MQKIGAIISGIISILFGSYIILEGKIPNRGGQYLELSSLWQSLPIGIFFIIFGVLVVWSIHRKKHRKDSGRSKLLELQRSK